MPIVFRVVGAGHGEASLAARAAGVPVTATPRDILMTYFFNVVAFAS